VSHAEVNNPSALVDVMLFLQASNGRW
jgi:hypothetical protein